MSERNDGPDQLRPARSPDDTTLAWATAECEIVGALLGSEQSVVLALIARHSRALLDAILVAVALPSGEPGLLSVVAADGPGSSGLVGTRFPIDGVLSWPIADDANGSRRIDEWEFDETRIGPLIAVPLDACRLDSGALVIAAEPTSGVLAVATSFARQAALTQRLRPRVDAHDPDLYDTILNRIYLAGLSLAQVQRQIPPAALAHISAVTGQLDLVVADIRAGMLGR